MEKKENSKRSDVLEPTVRAVLIVDSDTLWLEDVLKGLAAQDYKKIDFLLVHPSKEKIDLEVEELVKRTVPSAKLIKTETSKKYPYLANLAIQKGPVEVTDNFLLFIKDDLILDATCVRRMVELAIESNAGIVGPKVLDAENPTQLEDMGAIMDHFCSPVSRTEKGENDQGQYDLPKEVSVVPESAMLIRTDLFKAIGGYDLEIESPDNNVEICLRSELVGAKILLASNSVATRLKNRKSATHQNVQVSRPRNRIRMTFTSNFGIALIRSVLESICITGSGIVYGLITGRFSLTWGHISSFVWNLQRLKSLSFIRSKILDSGTVISKNKGRLKSQQHSFRRAVIGIAPSGKGPEALTRIRLHQLWSALLGPGGIALLVAGSVLGFGSRHLLTRGLPEIGRFQKLPDDPLDLFNSWWHGWRSTATGMETVGPDGFSVLGLILSILPGDDQLLWSWIIVAAIPIGAVGVWRLVRPIGGGRSRAVAFLVYLSMPLPYDSLREGRLTPLIVYALLPWWVKRLAVSQGVAPYGSIGGQPGPGVKERTQLTDGLLTGLLLAIGIAFDPIFLLPAVLIFLAFFLGSFLSGSTNGMKRLFKSFSMSLATAAFVHLPLLIDLSTGRTLNSLFGFEAWRKGALGVSGVFNFNTGTFTNSPVTWLLLVVAAFAMLVGTKNHLFIGIRAWWVIGVGFFTVWCADQGWWSGRIPEQETLFVIVAVGIAWASAVATAGIGSDLTNPLLKKPFLRKISIGIAALALGVSAVPVLTGSLNGSWGTPRNELSSVLSFVVEGNPSLDARIRGGEDRIVWLGEPSILPAAASLLTEDVGLAITDGMPDLRDQWPYSLKDNLGISEIRKGIARAIAGDTNRLGEIIGEWGVKYLIIVEGIAPVPYQERRFQLPSFYEAAFTRQLDLARTEGLNSAVTIFENTAHESVYAVVRDSNRKVVPAEVTKLSEDRYFISSNADGALRWMIEPDENWKLYINEREAPLLQPGASGGLINRKSVRVASGTNSILQLDTAESKVRNRLQIALFIIVLLAANWSRLRLEKSYQ